jgi:hypothetical protein
MVAAAGGHWKCVRVLLEQGADVETKDAMGRTAKVAACDACLLCDV